uniref:Uncharacterized protein n=1 Tax=Dromaius novaehollandiae TaxID=8790 RepID=A0A8C4JQ53_DRONO
RDLLKVLLHSSSSGNLASIYQCLIIITHLSKQNTLSQSHNVFLVPEANTTSVLMLVYPQFNSEENFSTRSFDMLENVSMTSARREKLSSRGLNSQGNEASAGKLSLQRYPLLTCADQEDQVSLSGITELLNVTKKPQAPFFKYDLEIPPQAKIASVPLSSLPLKIQQLMSSRTKNVSEIRQAPEISSVTYVWPVIKMKDPSKSFLAIFPKSLTATSPNLAKHSSSLQVVSGDVQCSQITPVKQLVQEELLTARSCPLTVKSSNSIVSLILKSLTNTKNKDLKNILPLQSISPTGDQIEIPLFKHNALKWKNMSKVFDCLYTQVIHSVIFK